MSPERFKHLLSLVRPMIEKEDTNMRKAIPAAERLALTLCFLATGDSQQSLSFSFRIRRSTISKIISETCDAVYTVLRDKYLKVPNTHDEWLKIVNDFEEKWNMPHVLGCIDGKHIWIECPKLSGTLYHNYKGFFSIVLMAICDANYCFTLIDLGQYGSNNDSGILANSRMGQMFDDNDMNVPSDRELYGFSNEKLPFYLLGDVIFPLKKWLMRPFPGKNASEEEKIYNYRHSRVRRCIENAFGILSARWRIFQKPIRASIDHVESYTLACLALHNYLRLTNNVHYSPKGFIDSEDNSGNLVCGDWRKTIGVENALQSIPNVRGCRPRGDAIKARNTLKEYFNSEEGSVSWQLDYVRRTLHFVV